jgi:short-subunit dehydrogenase
MRRWAAAEPTEFVLVGRSRERLDAVVDDLHARNPGTRAKAVEFDFSPTGDIALLLEGVFADGEIDVALIAHGSLPSQASIQGDLAAVRAALEINAIGPALFVEALADRMLRVGRGRLAVISSVAGDRGRRSNYVYGAAKALLSAYTEGVWHRLAGSGVTVTLIKPGPTATPMTEQLRSAGARLASADAVAASIVAGVDRGAPIVYAPPIWRLIMTVVRSIPRAVFRRLPL